MTGFNQAQSPRLGSPTPVESTFVRMFAGTEIPEAAWPGQMIYRTDTQELQVYTTHHPTPGWESVVGGTEGVLTFVGPSIPTAANIGDTWFDTDDFHKLYVAKSVGANEISDTEWKLTQDSHSAQVAADTAIAAVSDLDEAVLPDADPPSSSPTPSILPGISSLGVIWDAIDNHDPVTYEVHCSSSGGATFTPTSGTLQVETTATSYTIYDKLADGTQMVKDGTVTYWVRLVAKDLNPSGVFHKAAPSTGASGIPRLITTPDIASNYVYANYLDARWISGTEIQADLAVVGKIKTASSGQRVELTSEGLRQYGPDGRTMRVEFPNNPTMNPYFDGTIIADGLTLKKGIELRGQNNIFAMGSKTILQTQTVASATAPSISMGYPVSGITQSQWVNPINGFWFNSSETSKRFTTNFFNNHFWYHNNGRYKIPIVTRGDGSQTPDYACLSSTAIVVGGAERLVTVGLSATYSNTFYDDDYYLISWDDSVLVPGDTVAPIKKAQLSAFEFEWRWQWHIGRCFSPFVAEAARANQICQIKRDNNSLAWPSGYVDLTVYTVSDTAFTETLTRSLPNDGFLAQDENILGVTFGSSFRMGFAGTDEDIWVIHGSVNNYVYKDGTTLTRQGFREFPAIPNSKVVSAAGDLITNDFSYFYATPASDGPEIYRYTNITWGSGISPTWWGSFTWHDSIGTQHETGQSARAQLVMKQRTRLNVTVPQLPDPADGGTTPGADDVNSFRFYLARGATDPGRAAMALQTDPVDGATQAFYETVTFTTTPGYPPIATDFPAATAASVESNALGTGNFPKIKLTGDGLAHFEALDVGGEGATSLSGKAFEQLYYSIRAQSQLVGGGIKTVDASYNISWSQRFIMMSIGRSANTAAGGYFEIKSPGTFTVSNKVMSSGTATLTCAAHTFHAGDVVEVTGVDVNFNGVQTLTSVTNTTVSFAHAGTVTAAAATGWVNTYITGYGSTAMSSRPVTSSKVPLNAWEALWYEPPYARASTVWTVINKALTSNVATLTMPGHTCSAGEVVVVNIGDSAFDGQYVVSTVTATTITYAKTNANVTSAATSGTVNPLGVVTEWSNFRITYYNADFVVPNSWILLAMRNSDNTIMEFATGENVDPGYDSSIYNIGGQKIRKFNLGYATDTTNASGQCVYAHGLGTTPAQVLTGKGISGGTSFLANVSALTSTTFMVTYRKIADGTVQAAGVTCDVVFLAYAE